ncbi:putative large subunit ribosomal protein L22e [Paratrimastix pyriformis]|uniref:Large ribosomal subunit protein eL22 n=1 Tax=Paratrimastix pyriformis TaxID=342808 RepID=A0ABQ8UVK2_9EUKA|nr:putative large subunit ribosomal protein L22e [Paratrimastix pyriformis]|eukprot:EC836976.1.p2 GENE.EC836976.1~~EC836976.1.p2  ORF type:complete len:122 (+),score=46.76 EC836976.1:12-377(+)
MKGAPKQQKAAIVKFTLDCTVPATDGVMEASRLEKYLHDHIKVDGKMKNLQDKVRISRDKSKINVSARQPFSKRYVKYLTKRFLKHSNLRDWLRVIANDKKSYELRYFNIAEQEQEGADKQ